MRIFLLYADDGPTGPALQSMSITSPWLRLIEVDNIETASSITRAMPSQLSRLVANGSQGRLNSRIECVFSDDQEAVDFFFAAPVINVKRLGP